MCALLGLCPSLDFASNGSTTSFRCVVPDDGLTHLRHVASNRWNSSFIRLGLLQPPWMLSARGRKVFVYLDKGGRGVLWLQRSQAERLTILPTIFCAVSLATGNGPRDDTREVHVSVRYVAMNMGDEGRAAELEMVFVK